MVQGTFVPLTSRIVGHRRAAVVLALLAILLCFAPQAVSAENAPLSTVIGVDKSDIVRVRVLRVNPEMDFALTITPSSIERDFSLEATVTDKDSMGLDNIKAALWNVTIYAHGCKGVNYTAKTFPAFWAVLLFDDSGIMRSAIYLSNDGHCSVVANHLYALDPTLIIFLRRYFGFMN